MLFMFFTIVFATACCITAFLMVVAGDMKKFRESFAESAPRHLPLVTHDGKVVETKEQLEDELEMLNEKLQDKKQLLENSKLKVCSAESSIDKLTAASSEVKKYYSRLKNEIQKSEMECRELQQQIDEYKMRQVEIRNQMKNNEKRFENLLSNIKVDSSALKIDGLNSALKGRLPSDRSKESESHSSVNNINNKRLSSSQLITPFVEPSGRDLEVQIPCISSNLQAPKLTIITKVNKRRSHLLDKRMKKRDSVTLPLRQTHSVIGRPVKKTFLRLKTICYSPKMTIQGTQSKERFQLPNTEFVNSSKTDVAGQKQKNDNITGSLKNNINVLQQIYPQPCTSRIIEINDYYDGSKTSDVTIKAIEDVELKTQSITRQIEKVETDVPLNSNFVKNGSKENSINKETSDRQEQNFVVNTSFERNINLLRQIYPQSDTSSIVEMKNADEIQWIKKNYISRSKVSNDVMKIEDVVRSSDTGEVKRAIDLQADSNSVKSGKTEVFLNKEMFEQQQQNGDDILFNASFKQNFNVFRQIYSPRGTSDIARMKNLDKTHWIDKNSTSVWKIINDMIMKIQYIEFRRTSDTRQVQKVLRDVPENYNLVKNGNNKFFVSKDATKKQEQKHNKIPVIVSFTNNLNMSQPLNPPIGSISRIADIKEGNKGGWNNEDSTSRSIISDSKTKETEHVSLGRKSDANQMKSIETNMSRNSSFLKKGTNEICVNKEGTNPQAQWIRNIPVNTSFEKNINVLRQICLQTDTSNIVEIKSYEGNRWINKTSISKSKVSEDLTKGIEDELGRTSNINKLIRVETDGSADSNSVKTGTIEHFNNKETFDQQEQKEEEIPVNISSEKNINVLQQFYPKPDTSDMKIKNSDKSPWINEEFISRSKALANMTDKIEVLGLVKTTNTSHVQRINTDMPENSNSVKSGATNEIFINTDTSDQLVQKEDKIRVNGSLETNMKVLQKFYPQFSISGILEINVDDDESRFMNDDSCSGSKALKKMDNVKLERTSDTSQAKRVATNVLVEYNSVKSGTNRIFINKDTSDQQEQKKDNIRVNGWLEHNMNVLQKIYPPLCISGILEIKVFDDDESRWMNEDACSRSKVLKKIECVELERTSDTSQVKRVEADVPADSKYPKTGTNKIFLNKEYQAQNSISFVKNINVLIQINTPPGTQNIVEIKNVDDKSVWNNDEYSTSRFKKLKKIEDELDRTKNTSPMKEFQSVVVPKYSNFVRNGENKMLINMETSNKQEQPETSCIVEINSEYDKSHRINEHFTSSLDVLGDKTKTIEDFELRKTSDMSRVNRIESDVLVDSNSVESIKDEIFINKVISDVVESMDSINGEKVIKTRMNPVNNINTVIIGFPACYVPAPKILQKESVFLTFKDFPFSKGSPSDGTSSGYESDSSLKPPNSSWSVK